jgi:hypothetical protein
LHPILFTDLCQNKEIKQPDRADISFRSIVQNTAKIKN